MHFFEKRKKKVDQDSTSNPFLWMLIFGDEKSATSFCNQVQKSFLIYRGSKDEDFPLVFQIEKDVRSPREEGHDKKKTVVRISYKTVAGVICMARILNLFAPEELESEHFPMCRIYQTIYLFLHFPTAEQKRGSNEATPEGETSKKYSQIPLLKALEAEGVISGEDILALHVENVQKDLFARTLKSFFTNPISEIRDYYGEEIAYYFSFMESYMHGLMIPTIFGLVLYFVRPDGVTVAEAPYIPFYGLFISVWAFLFLRKWQQRESQMATDFLTFELKKKESIRTEFYGEWEKSPVTGSLVRMYPTWKRALKQFASALISISLLSFAIFAMFCSLNLQGYIKSHDSPVHIGAFHELSQPGRVFDPEGWFFIVPTLLHVLVINILNRIYRRIATALTDWENYKTEQEFEDALVFKRFLFEALDCFLPLFWIAFYQFDIILLRRELISLFSVDCIRRIVTETVIPWLSSKYHQKVSKSEAFQNLEPLELFDDYLEMVIQFGYLVLFANALPLGPFFAMLSNFLEIRADFAKLSFLSHKPLGRRCTSIGVWNWMLGTMAAISILTNTILFCVSSSQVVQWLPSLFNIDNIDASDTVEFGSNRIPLGAGKYILLLIFLIEHFLAFIALAIYFWFPEVSHKTRMQRKKIEYDRRQKILNAKLKKD